MSYLSRKSKVISYEELNLHKMEEIVEFFGTAVGLLEHLDLKGEELA